MILIITVRDEQIREVEYWRRRGDSKGLKGKCSHNEIYIRLSVNIFTIHYVSYCHQHH